MEGIDSYIGEKTEVIDLQGKFAMPAFVESHLHPLSNAYAYNFQAALFGLNTPQRGASFPHRLQFDGIVVIGRPENAASFTYDRRSSRQMTWS
jgi:predicted amidohydrolase YtcJ